MRRILLIALLVVACGKSQSVVPPPQPMSSQPEPRVVFPDGFVVSVEIAADEDTRARGLMFRDALRPATGMLFLFPSDGRYPFWMKNTLIPLDMIWIDSSNKIVFVGENAQPCKIENCPNIDPGANARYVLEVAGGVASAHGLKAGDVLRVENVQTVHVE